MPGHHSPDASAPNATGEDRRRRARGVLLGAVVLALGLTAAATAQAAPGWLSPEDLTEAGGSLSGPQVAVDSHGSALAGWERYEGSGNERVVTVQVAARPAGGSWGVPENLSIGGPESASPRWALGADGTAVAVWERYQDSSGNRTATVRTAVRPPGGEWSDQQDLETGTRPEVAVDRQGNAVAIWQRYGEGGAPRTLRTATRPAGGPWSTPRTIATGEDQFTSLIGHQLAFDALGNAVAIWYRYDGTNATVRAATRTAQDEWSAPQDLSGPFPLQYAEGPDLAVDAEGNAVVAWHSNYVHVSTVHAVTRPAGGSWDTVPELVSGAGQYANSPQVALDAEGNAVAVWSRWNSSSSTISTVHTASRPPGGS